MHRNSGSLGFQLAQWVDQEFTKAVIIHTHCLLAASFLCPFKLLLPMKEKNISKGHFDNGCFTKITVCSLLFWLLVVGLWKYKRVHIS